MANDPIQGLIDYVNDIKPYHTKIVETAVGYAQFDDIATTITDVLELGITLIIPSVTVGSPPIPLQICSEGWSSFWDRPSPYVVVGPNATGAFPNSLIRISGDFSSIFNSGTKFEVRHLPQAGSPATAGSPAVLTFSTSTGAYESVSDTTVITIAGSPALDGPILAGYFFFPTPILPDLTSGDVFVIYDVVSTTATVGSPVFVGSPYPIRSRIVVSTDNSEEFSYGRGFEIRNATDLALNKTYHILTTRFTAINELEITTTDAVLVDSVLDGEMLFLSTGWDGPDFCQDIPTGLLQNHISDELVQQWQCIGSPCTNIVGAGAGSPCVPPRVGSPYPGGVIQPEFPFTENFFQHFILEVGSPKSLNEFIIEGNVTFGSPADIEVIHAVKPPYPQYPDPDALWDATLSYGKGDVVLRGDQFFQPCTGSPCLSGSPVATTVGNDPLVNSPNEWIELNYGGEFNQGLPQNICIGGSPVQKFNLSLSDNNHEYTVISSTYDPLTNRSTVVVGSPGIKDPYPTGWIVPIGCGSTPAPIGSPCGGSPFAAIVAVLTLTNNTTFVTGPDPVQNMEAGYELQTDGFAYAVSNIDDDAGPPSFLAVNTGTDWIIPHAAGVGPGTYHARMTFVGGSSALDQGTLGVWLEIGVDSIIWTIANGAGSGFNDWIGTLEISDDGGSTTIDSATITLETDVV